MKCPFCAHLDDKVIDSREARTGDLIRRRRECLKCSRRFTTYERIDEIPYMVIKKDGRREKFERQKILQGLLKACEKRPVPVGKLETIVDEAEAFVSEAAGARAHDHRDRRAADEPPKEARQGRLRPLCVRLSRFQGREGIHGRAEGPAEGSREEIARRRAYAVDLSFCPYYSCVAAVSFAQDETQFVCPRHIEVPIYAYPQIARVAHVSGEVAVNVTIDADGKVVGAEVVSGSALSAKSVDRQHPEMVVFETATCSVYADDDLRVQAGRNRKR